MEMVGRSVKNGGVSIRTTLELAGSKFSADW
jgi:hypothetical protein